MKFCVVYCSEDEYDELDHRAEDQYWMIDNKLKIEESYAHGEARDNADTGNVEVVSVSTLAVNKLMR